MKNHKEENGHVDVPGDEGRLGKWVAEIRKRPPSPDKVERLNEIGFEWDGRASRSRNAWRAGCVHSFEYYRNHGDIKVPGGYVCGDGYKLGTFIKNLKRDKRLDELLDELKEAVGTVEAVENTEAIEAVE